eukprot:COSAG05_NODE_457_length_9624_cov_14.129554_6_plen_43_part_00
MRAQAHEMDATAADNMLAAVMKNISTTIQMTLLHLNQTMLAP